MTDKEYEKLKEKMKGRQYENEYVELLDFLLEYNKEIQPKVKAGMTGHYRSTSISDGENYCLRKIFKKIEEINTKYNLTEEDNTND